MLMLCPECPAISVVGRPMLPQQLHWHPVAAHNPSELQQQQEKDATLKILLQAKDIGKKPDPESFQHTSVKVQRLL